MDSFEAREAPVSLLDPLLPQVFGWDLVAPVSLAGPLSPSAGPAPAVTAPADGARDRESIRWLGGLFDSAALQEEETGVSPDAYPTPRLVLDTRTTEALDGLETPLAFGVQFGGTVEAEDPGRSPLADEPAGQPGAGPVSTADFGPGAVTVADGVTPPGSPPLPPLSPPPPANSAPVAQNDSYTVVHDRQLDVDEMSGLLANDTDADGDDLQVVIVTEPANGDVEMQFANTGAGSFRYTPAQGYVGNDSFTYKVGDGTAYSQVATVTIAVTNQAPLAAGEAFSNYEDAVVFGSVLENDYDADDDPVQAQLASGVANGSLVLQDDGYFTYTPNPNYAGSDSFTYTVTDGVVSTAPVTVSLAVQPGGPFDIDGRDPTTEFPWMHEDDEGAYGLGVNTSHSGQIYLRVYNLPSTTTVQTRRVSWDYTLLSVGGVTYPGYIDLSPTGGNEQLSVVALNDNWDMTQINYQITGSVSIGGEFPEMFAAINPIRVNNDKAVIRSVQFTSDHNLIRENRVNVLTIGPRYDAVEFVRRTGYNAPITQSWDSAIQLDLNYRMSSNIQAGDQYRVVGVSNTAALNFQGPWIVWQAGGGVERVAGLTATNKVSKDIYKFSDTIDWRLEIWDPVRQQLFHVPMGRSGPHRVYVTWETPKTYGQLHLLVTDIRMELTVQYAGQALADARLRTMNNNPTPARVVYQILRQHQFNLRQSIFGRNYRGPATVWLVPRYWAVGGADCISGAAFSSAVGNMAGIPGDISYISLAAKSDAQPTVAVDYTTLPGPRTKVLPVNGKNYQFTLTHLDQGNGENNFEACVKYITANGNNTYYFPSGIAEDPVTQAAVAYGNPDHVLYVFQKLSWAATIGGQQWTSTVFNYRPIPANVTLVGID